jgi:hypothetical protein
LTLRFRNNAIPNTLFVPSLADVNVLSNYGKLIAWSVAAERIYSQKAQADFAAANAADAHLIATAMTYDYTIITQESSDLKCKNRVKIPDAAKAHGVACINIRDALRLHSESNFSFNTY